MNTYYISYVWKYDGKQNFSYTYHKADKMTQDELYIVQEDLNKQHRGGMYFQGIAIISWNKFEE